MAPRPGDTTGAPAVFRANRILSYWTPWDPERLADRVAAIRPQVLQIGHFGPLLYSLAHTEHWGYFGVPVAGIDGQVEWWRRFVAEVHARGVKVVGLISLGYFFGDHESKWGWFRFWEELWDEAVLGPRPCVDPMTLVQVDEQGQRKFAPRGAETRNWYNACLNNPDWIATLKGMVRQGIGQIGLDGYNSVYNYAMGCCCQHCQARLRQHLAQRYDRAQLRDLGIADIDTHRFERMPHHFDPGDSRLTLECVKFTHLSLKAAYDEVFVRCGRSLKPDMIAATWFHQYSEENFGQLGNDERSALPATLWARDEDYLWYCLGRQEHTELAKGYLADLTVECKWLLAAGGGKPFIPNRYDERRLPLYAAESLAAGGAAIGWHWDTGAAHTELEVQRYTAILGDLFRFVEERASCYRDAEPYADCALVFPRTSVLQGYNRFARTFRRFARRLADGHVLFEVVMDEALPGLPRERYRTVVFADAACAGEVTVDWVREFARHGGQAVLTRTSLTRDETGRQRAAADLADIGPEDGDVGPFALRRCGEGRLVWVGEVPRDEAVTDRGHGERHVGPALAQDGFGARFVELVRQHCRRLQTDAPWTVRFHAFRQAQPPRLLLHLLNFDNDEASTAYCPVVTGPIAVDLQLPAGARTAAVTYAAPWGGGEQPLAFAQSGDRVKVTLPPTEVYGLLRVEAE